MIRCRFYVNPDDPRPVNWPIKHPYWVSGETGDGARAILVAYADDENEILRNWPDAENMTSDERAGYTFTDRFAKPDWWKPSTPEQGGGK